MSFASLRMAQGCYVDCNCYVWPLGGLAGMCSEMRVRTATLVPAVLLVCALGLALAACGGGSDGGNKPTPTSPSGTPGADTTPAASGTLTGGGAGGSNATVAVDNATARVGEEASVELKVLDVGTPGLGAWTIDVSFDADIVSASTCTTNQAFAYCNAKFDSDTIRTVGADAQGASGDVSISTITFRCEKAGSSDLTISVDTLADATIGNPTDINHTEQDGSITCS